MCACEEQLALQFLPHQTTHGREFGTQRRHVVAGFVSNLCPSCRGESELPFPMAAVQGRKGKIERFYWREITRSYYGFARKWLAKNGEKVSDIIEFERRFLDLSKTLRKQARQYWQKEHRSNPKYVLSEPTQERLYADLEVPEIDVHAAYVQVQRGGQKLGKWYNSEGELVSAEVVATEFYRSQGWEAHACERKLISILYGTFCFSVVQDSGDSEIVVGYRNSTRGWTNANRETALIGIPLPQDFGSPHHFERRIDEYTQLFGFLRSQSLPEVLDDWLEPSESLRDYLWVNDDTAVALARVAVRAIPRVDILRWVEWAARSFWQRQPGWPDLLLTREDGFRFAEVKSPHDSLSQEQLRWFRWALGDAEIPCEVCRIKKSKQPREEASSA